MRNLSTQINFVDTWYLTKNSFVFLSQNYGFNVFPLTAIFIISTLLVADLQIIPYQTPLQATSILDYFMIACSYFLIFFVIIFFNTALALVTLKRLNGDQTSAGEGFHFAYQHRANLFKWALVASTVGVVAKLFEELQKIIEKLFKCSLGVTWSSATFFLLPIIIAENLTPLQAMQRSIETVGLGFKHTVKIQSLISVIFIFVMLVISEFLPAYPKQTTNLLIAIIPAFLLTGMLGMSLDVILTNALYLNQVQARGPKAFDATVLNRAFIKEE